MITADFKPSQVVLSIPPLRGTMKRVEMEYAAALIVYACTVKGDAWQPITFADVRAASRLADTTQAPTPRQQWIADALRNPFLHPDVHGLIRAGFAEQLGTSGPLVVQFLPSGLEAIRKWVAP